MLTAADSAELIRSAARAGVIGVVRKSESAAAVLAAVDAALKGETFPTTEWAAAIDADDDLPDAGLSARERQVLELYAAGEKAQTVAYRTGFSRATVNQYVSHWVRCDQRTEFRTLTGEFEESLWRRRGIG